MFSMREDIQDYTKLSRGPLMSTVDGPSIPLILTVAPIGLRGVGPCPA